MIEIKNLYAATNGKEILKGIDLNLEEGKIYVLIGPNGSGKTTLANVLMGNPKYKAKGEIIFNNENISNFSPTERAKKGIFLSFQFPTEISGVTVSNFLRTTYNSLKKKISFLEFQKLLEEKAKKLNFNKKFLTRYLNEGFSGGEKKKSEILQMSILDPRFVILDEIDSGLDKDSLKQISNEINNFMNKEKCILIITHHREILNYINTDKMFLMLNGKIVSEENETLNNSKPMKVK